MSDDVCAEVTVMSPPQLSNVLWQAIEARNWPQVKGLLHENFYARFPQSGEVFDRELYVSMNEFYPGDWHVMPLSVMVNEDWVVTEVEVKIDGRVDYGISYMRVQNGLIMEIREYWAEHFDVPQWRAKLHECC